MSYLKDPCGRGIEEQGYSFSTWRFMTPDYDMAYIFYDLLTHIYIPSYEIFEVFEMAETYNIDEGMFMYVIAFDCRKEIRKRIEYIFRRLIDQEFALSYELLDGLTDENYCIERV